MLLFDMRNMKTVRAYRGFTGGIRDVICHPTSPVIVSVGLDRFVRVHRYDSQTPILKTYLKSRLNTLLLRKDFNLNIDSETVEALEGDQGSKTATADNDLWNAMEVVCEDKPPIQRNRKRKA